MTTTSTPNYYRLKRPCKRCPFRSDIVPYIRGERAAEIARTLMEGATFTCHETTVDAGDEDGSSDMAVGPKAAMCAGATITMLKTGQPNQMLRVGMNLGMLNPDAVDLDFPTYNDLGTWSQAIYSGEPNFDPGTALENCGVVGSDCVDPAGYGVGGGAMNNPEPGTIGPDSPECGMCGNKMCEGCVENAVPTNSGGVDILVCEYCAEEEE